MEIRMLRWMCEIRNEIIQEKFGMTSVADKMREAKQRWFGHVQKRSVDAHAKR